MPKKKKTRKQKELADVRRQTEPSVSHTATIKEHQPVREEPQSASTPNDLRPQKTVSRHVVTTAEYNYVSKDLRKTLILTAVILIAEIVLKQVTGF